VEAQQVTDGFGAPLQLHPSGMTLKEWNYPFKTPEQMVLVMAWYKHQQQTEAGFLEPSPF
jgi:hypothetical protein